MVLPAIVGYTAVQLDSAAPVPHLILADSSMTLVGALAFDTAGNLWVPSVDNCEIVEYTASQLASLSGVRSAAPSLKFTTQCQSPVIGPSALAFDAAGNLWVGDLASHTIYEYDRFGLTGSGTVTRTPGIVLTLPGLSMPSAIAFDVNDNLWVAGDDSTVFVYDPASLGFSGSPPPLRTLTISRAVLVSLAFDHGGNLWLANFIHSEIDELTAAQLGNGGLVTPAVVITGDQNSVLGPTGLAFTPAISGLPLFTRRR
jgi:streptogramin lyase